MIDTLIHYFQSHKCLWNFTSGDYENQNKKSLSLEEVDAEATTQRCSENMQQIYRRTTCRRVISIKLQSNFIEIALRQECSPVNLLHIFRTPFLKNTSGWLLLSMQEYDMDRYDYRKMDWSPRPIQLQLFFHLAHRQLNQLYNLLLLSMQHPFFYNPAVISALFSYNIDFMKCT